MFFFKNLTEGQRKLAATIGFVVMIVALLAMSGLNDKQAPQDAASGADTSVQVVAASSDEQASADKTEATDEPVAADKPEATANVSGEASADAAAAMTQSSEETAN